MCSKNPLINKYHHVKERCTNKKLNHYKYYGGRGIKFLLSQKEFNKLWFRDKAYEMKKPSIDRIDNDGNYEFNNCRFIELGENSCKDKRKIILQYDLQGNFIREWKSQADITFCLNYSHSNISKVCIGKRNSAYGYIWKFK